MLGIVGIFMVIGDMLLEMFGLVTDTAYWAIMIIANVYIIAEYKSKR